MIIHTAVTSEGGVLYSGDEVTIHAYILRSSDGAWHSIESGTAFTASMPAIDSKSPPVTTSNVTLDNAPYGFITIKYTGEETKRIRAGQSTCMLVATSQDGASTETFEVRMPFIIKARTYATV